MKDEHKTKKQLINELIELGQRITELEASETRRKWMEEALRESEEKYRRLIETANDAIFIADAETGIILDVNKKAEELLDMPAEKIVGMHQTQLHPKEEAKRYGKIFLDHIQSGKAILGDLFVCHKDGHKIPVEVSASVTELMGQKVIQGIFRDITERKWAEEALRESEEKFRSISTSAQDGIIMMDNDGNISYWNEAAERMFGYTKEEAIGKEVHIFLGPERYHEAYRKGFKGFKKTGKGPVVGKTLELSAIRKDGMEFPIELSVSSVKVQGKWHSIGILRDITERKRAEEELKKYRHHLEELVEERTAELKTINEELQREIVERKRMEEALKESEEKYRRIFETSKDVLYLTSREGKFIDINQAGVDLFGYSKEELLKIDLARHLYVKPEDRKRFQEMIEKDGFVKDYEVEWKKKDKTKVYVSITANVRKDRNGNALGYEGIIRDITDKKRAEEALAQKAQELARSNAELQQFAFVASHDLQEPLHAVSGYVQLLARRYKDKLDTDADDFIARTLDGVNRMQTLIKDLLAYSRVGTYGKTFKPTDCKAAFNRTLTNLQAAIEESSAVVTHDPLPILMADASQLVQLFQNLIGNAIKFRSEEPPRVHISAEQKGNEWIFSVQDNGIGIDPKYTKDIFTIFQRLDSSRNYSGTGIGLALCKKIVERHGGRIWVDSEQGRGSTFYFTIQTA